MATNLVALNVYQFNQAPINVQGVFSKRMLFPTQGFLIQDTSGSTTRSLSTGFNVYSSLQGPTGSLYFVSETVSQILSAFNA